MDVEYTIFAILINFLLYLVGGVIIFKNGGLKNNLIFGFCWMLFTVYYFITPTYFYSVGRETIWGDEFGYKGVGVGILDFYDTGLTYYFLANLSFLIGYLFFNTNNNKIKAFSYKQLSSRQLLLTKRSIYVTFVICFSLVMFNFLNEGFNPILILMGDGDQLAGQTATSNYLKNFSDSLIALVILAYYYKVPRPAYYLMVFLSFALFILMGFRYRIIVSLVGMGFVWIHNNQLTLKTIVKIGLSSLSFFYLMFFITYNRYVFVVGDWDKLVINPSEFKMELVFEQTRGMLADINIIKYYHTNPDAYHDNGVTFLYFLVRIIPRSIVGDEFKDSLYPFPANKVITDAYDVEKDWGKGNTGEAPLHLAYFYIAFGLAGLIIISFLVGLFLNYMVRRFSIDREKYLLLHILVAVSFFQWITRGYFPGFVDHISFVLVGYFMVYGFRPYLKLN